MSRRLLPLVALVFGVACSDANAPTASPAEPVATQAATPRAAREHLARVLAMALSDPSTRAAVKRRLDASNAPEGKLQYQALLHSDQSALITTLARAGVTTPAELLSDLDAARGLELYLPIAAQRAAWKGDANYLVGTIGSDSETPVGFDAAGVRYTLDRNAPPSTPVLALVPQETDFTRGHPENLLSCVDMCGGGNSGGGGSTGAGGTGIVPGVYIVQSHFNSTYESWLKGNPEFEFHIYGTGDSTESVQLTCTGEHAKGAYTWDQNTLDWTGQALLISDADYNAYQARHPGEPLRIVAWEDDDEACVDHVDVGGVQALVTAVDNFYKAFTSGKATPWYARGLSAAKSVFSLVTAMHNIILTNDDFIGNAVDGAITGDAPGSSNWVLKSNGAVTTGWFTTQRLP
jgi:hypothetical protein